MLYRYDLNFRVQDFLGGSISIVSDVEVFESITGDGYADLFNILYQTGYYGPITSNLTACQASGLCKYSATSTNPLCSVMAITEGDRAGTLAYRDTVDLDFSTFDYTDDMVCEFNVAILDTTKVATVGKAVTKPEGKWVLENGKMVKVA